MAALAPDSTGSVAEGQAPLTSQWRELHLSKSCLVLLERDKYKHFPKNKNTLQRSFRQIRQFILLKRQKSFILQAWNTHFDQNLSRAQQEPRGTVRGAGIRVMAREHQRALESFCFQEDQGPKCKGSTHTKEYLKNRTEGCRVESRMATQ